MSTEEAAEFVVPYLYPIYQLFAKGGPYVYILAILGIPVAIGCLILGLAGSKRSKPVLVGGILAGLAPLAIGVIGTIHGYVLMITKLDAAELDPAYYDQLWASGSQIARYPTWMGLFVSFLCLMAFALGMALGRFRKA